MTNASIDTQSASLIKTDPEWSGKINRAASSQGTFSLLLAMLHTDIMLRPSISSEKGQAGSEAPALPNYYPVANLKASENDYKHAEVCSALVHQNLHAARLWQVMHPEPLSLFNDEKFIPPEVLANCNVRSAFKQQAVAELNVDETLLHDILSEISPSTQAQA